ncbi:MAG: asparagine--tRNA ligase, partial [Balneolaceae bacterium]
MIHKQRIRDLLQSDNAITGIKAAGWVRTRRDSRGFSFLELNDGSCLANIQVIADSDIDGYARIQDMNTGAAIKVNGDLVASPGKGQKWEIKATALELFGKAPDDYPLQKKRHSDEFLRTIAHLRSRTNKYGAMFRIRSRLALAVHDFFRDRGFYWIHTPIITGSDCEGAGDLFRVTTMDLNDVPKSEGKVDYDQDFFGKEAHLTVSGQLSLEACCLSLGKVYTFGPTFRSENSNTSRHIAEFWMIEPEIAFADLADNMALGQELIQYLCRYVMEHCSEDLELFSRFVDTSLMQRLTNISEQDFVRMHYTDAIEVLQKSGREFVYTPEWGKDLQS